MTLHRENEKNGIPIHKQPVLRVLWPSTISKDPEAACCKMPLVAPDLPAQH